jgi:hypothetical protein
VPACYAVDAEPWKAGSSLVGWGGPLEWLIVRRLEKIRKLTSLLWRECLTDKEGRAMGVRKCCRARRAETRGPDSWDNWNLTALSRTAGWKRTPGEHKLASLCFSTADARTLVARKLSVRDLRPERCAVLLQVSSCWSRLYLHNGVKTWHKEL